MDELKPCPFCGNTDLIPDEFPDDYREGTMYGVLCLNPNCGAIGPVRLEVNPAIEAWNRRPLEDQTRKWAKAWKKAATIYRTLTIEWEEICDIMKTESHSFRYGLDLAIAKHAATLKQYRTWSHLWKQAAKKQLQQVSRLRASLDTAARKLGEVTRELEGWKRAARVGSWLIGVEEEIEEEADVQIP